MLQRPLLLFLAVLFTCNGAFAQKEGEAYTFKLSTFLKTHMAVYQPADSLAVVLSVSSIDSFEKAAYKKARVVAAYRPAGVVTVRVKKIDLIELISQQNILFADVVKKPSEELTTGYLDLAVNKINYAHVQFPSIDGDGILVSVKEQRLDTADIDYKSRYLSSGLEAASVSTHASIMATTIAGGGNTSPFATGAAPAARVTSASFTNLLPDEDAVFQHYPISVQNHSYGTVAESYYGAEAMAYDKSVVRNPTVVHVFSAGNAGLSAGPAGAYAGLQGFANLTGNFKQSKNSIVVGAIDSFYNIAAASSKGPAFDGRIKPELVAFGEDGSSGAAALVSGTAALVQQAYQSRHQVLPTASTVKAVLLNSADDAGTPHPDYASGYGSLNGFEAVKTVMENHLFENAITSGSTQTFPLVVPPNTAQLKVTLAWTDGAAAVNAPRALVNDLDMVVKNSRTGESWQPWVLDPTASAEALKREAVRATDTLNNVEQITIQNPIGGSYEILVTGTHMLSDRQLFSIAYQVDTLDEFEWTFPAANEIVRGGNSNVIRWQSNRSGTAVLEYTTGNDQWTTIAEAVDVRKLYFKWEVPDTLTTAQLRMRFSNGQALTDTFVISRAVNVQVGFNCADSFLLFWNHLPVTAYQIYRLGEKYLEPILLTTDTTVIFKKAQHPSLYYSVAPVINGRNGLKSYTINYTGQGAECYFRSFYAQLQTADRVDLFASIGSLYGVTAIALQKRQSGGYTTIQPIAQPVTTAFIFTDSVLTQGLNQYRLQLTLSNGAVLYSDVVSIYHFSNAPVIIYPNPARQQESIKVITNGAGRYRIAIWSATGALIRQMQLTELVNQLPPLQLSKGVYLIRITGEDGSRSTQKLVVY